MAKRILFLILLITSVSFASNCYAEEEMDAFIKNTKRCNLYFSYFEEKYNIPALILKSISLAESGRWCPYTQSHVTWPWAINVAGSPFYFDSKEEALKFVSRMTKKGKTNIDVGCMQINLGHHPKAFANLDDALEPMLNIEYAAQFLLSNYQKYGNWKEAIAAYHSKSNLGKIYLAKITTLLSKQKITPIKAMINNYNNKSSQKQGITKAKTKTFNEDKKRRLRSNMMIY
jgi:hypothetical protein